MLHRGTGSLCCSSGASHAIPHIFAKTTANKRNGRQGQAGARVQPQSGRGLVGNGFHSTFQRSFEIEVTNRRRRSLERLLAPGLVPYTSSPALTKLQPPALPRVRPPRTAWPRRRRPRWPAEREAPGLLLILLRLDQRIWPKPLYSLVRDQFPLYHLITTLKGCVNKLLFTLRPLSRGQATIRGNRFE